MSGSQSQAGGMTPGAGADPSMEDILASIRRILSEEDSSTAPAAKPAASPAKQVSPPVATPAAERPQDVLVLDNSMLVAEAPARPSPPSPAPPSMAPPVTARTPSVDSERPAQSSAPQDVLRNEPREVPAPPALVPPVTEERPMLAAPSFGAPVLVPVSTAGQFAPPPLITPPASVTREPPVLVHREPPALVHREPEAAAPSPSPAAVSPPASPLPAPSIVSAPVLAPPALAPAAEPAPIIPSQPERPAMSASISPQSGIASSEATAAAASSVSNLVRALTSDRGVQTHSGGPTIADLVREEMRPLLKNWLDANLPPMVERLVRAEIDRVIARATL